MDLTYFLNFLNRSLEDLVGINNTKLGLDIEPSSSALVHLSGSLSVPKLTRVDFQKMATGIVTDEHIHNPSALTQVVSLLATETRTRLKSNVSIAAPGSLVITKKIPLKEGFPTAEMGTFAWNEARKAFPGLTDNLYLDYLLLPENKLLLVAARKKELQDRLGSIVNAGLTVEAIDVDYYALARAFSLVKNQLKTEDLQQYTALVNIDTNALILVVMQNEELAFFHRQTYSGGFLADSVNQYLYDSTPKESENSPLNVTVKEALDAQVKRLYQFFQTDFPGRKLSQLILSGRLALIPGMRELIENALNIPTQLANPLSGLQVDISLKQRLERQAPALMLSCGLAMRGLRT